jgi:hypothetical protein
MFRRKARAGDCGPSRLDPRVGIRSVSFPTFGWKLHLDQPHQRSWGSDDGGAVLSVNFFPVPPDLPSLDTTELEGLFGTRRRDDDSRQLVIELAVQRDRPVPLVRVVTRQRVPEHDRYAFIAALLAPLAQCSWVVKVSRLEGGVTGVRETLAFGEYVRDHPDRLDASGLPDEAFDPYARAWDGKGPDEFDPLSVVRRRSDELASALEFGPEVSEQARFVVPEA